MRHGKAGGAPAGRHAAGLAAWFGDELMSKVLNFLGRKRDAAAAPGPDLAAFLEGCSIEVMPRTAAKVESFAAILPAGTRVYVAHIDGTPIEDMVATAARLAREGFPVMPHFPARIIADKATLADWIARYKGEAGVTQALLLGGGLDKPRGEFHSSMQLLETGLFEGFERLHVAGHPEGNRDIDPDGSEKNVMEALRWKQAFAERTDAAMAIVTQFCFEAAPVIAWAERLKAEGVGLPIHIGVAGPAKLQTLIKFSLACGVGPSLRVLQRRAADVTKLMLPFAPDEILRDLAAHKAAHPDFAVEAVHFFPLGGIDKTAEYINAHRRGARAAAAAG
ncbi:methylenetetrahydrofolate reductase (NADPH) [Oceanicella actignis]|uniref:Methylenetetrahydrofolate reductase (NADPH) n=2 Tax=Oceanicella actignis TaxID=1189325 RepID=A0A1M7SQQ8_9RHOB|nr:methylenetetrahydrofolate reductase (NADPH) [Oceanicella actignis]SHN60764.1 methylenetetrahydrofolate reductase (NADPH) [Oceanicella actignis]